PHALLDAGQRLERRLLHVGGERVLLGKERAHLGADREAGGHRQSKARHLGEAGALAAEQVAPLGIALRLAVTEEEHVRRHGFLLVAARTVEEKGRNGYCSPRSCAAFSAAICAWASAATSAPPPRMFPRPTGTRKRPRYAPIDASPLATAYSVSTEPAITCERPPRPIKYVIPT